MWKDEIKHWDDFNWTSLKAELDSLTFNRFTPFFCKEVLCCDNLWNEFKPFIAMNMKMLEESKSELFSGSVISRQGVSASVGGANYNISGVGSLTGYRTASSPTILPQLHTLLIKYGLSYPAPRNDGIFTCGSCGGCLSAECERCGGDEC